MPCYFSSCFSASSLAHRPSQTSINIAFVFWLDKPSLRPTLRLSLSLTSAAFGCRNDHVAGPLRAAFDENIITVTCSSNSSLIALAIFQYFPYELLIINESRLEILDVIAAENIAIFYIESNNDSFVASRAYLYRYSPIFIIYLKSDLLSFFVLIIRQHKRFLVMTIQSAGWVSFLRK